MTTPQQQLNRPRLGVWVRLHDVRHKINVERHVPVVLEVVLLEGYTHGQADRQVADEAQDTVVHRPAMSEGQVVGYLVHGQHKRVVDYSPETVGGHQ